MKRTVLIIILISLLSCATGGYPPSEPLQGDRELKRFREEFLRGKFCTALTAFKSALSHYARVDSVCDVAEAYLELYLFYAYIGIDKADYLNRAKETARLDDRCQNELKRIVSYERGEPEGDDALSRSVRFRKEALKRGDLEKLKKAMAIDRENNWTALLWYDLRIMSEITGDERYQKRLNLVEKNLEVDCINR